MKRKKGYGFLVLFVRFVYSIMLRPTPATMAARRLLTCAPAGAAPGWVGWFGLSVGDGMEVGTKEVLVDDAVVVRLLDVCVSVTTRITVRVEVDTVVMVVVAKTAGRRNATRKKSISAKDVRLIVAGSYGLLFSRC